MGKCKNVRRLKRVRQMEGRNKADISIKAMENEEKVLGEVLGDRRPYTQRVQRGGLK